MSYRLTDGGLALTLKAGCPADLVHMWWHGARLNKDFQDYYQPGGDLLEAGEFLIEVEIVKTRGNAVTLRINAPQWIQIKRAKIDEHC